MQNKPLLGSLMVLGAAMLWGTTGTAQSLAPVQLSPYWVGALRLAMASVFFAVYVLFTLPHTALLSDLRRLPLRWVALSGTFVAIYNLSFFAGVRESGVAVGTAIAIGSGPLWAGLLQWLVARQAPRPIWWLGTVLAVVGGACMVLSGGHEQALSLSGIALCLCAGFSYAAYALLNQRLVQQAAPSVVTLLVFGVAAIMAVPAAMWTSSGFVISTSGWLVVGYLGFAATGVAYLLFSSALRYISGASSVTLALAEPLTAFLLAIVVVGEHPSTGAFAGLTLVLLGLAAVIWVEMKWPAARSANGKAAPTST